ncbi:MAG: formylmethanofuran dehydrogenase subunit C [Alphaproteobacteria bacterium]|nr:formylmethanofuran dehydrogenase subunit C [Alphaproteobacteria bacterium]
MKPLVLTLNARPPQRLDLSPLVPHRLAGKSAAEIRAIELQTTRMRVTVGDIFRVRMGDAGDVRIEGACDRLDRIGEAMSAGTILVHGDVGAQAGRLMSGGRLVIEGTTGPWAGSAMRGGLIEIGGAAGDRLGGPLAGETAGMRGGVIVVRGNAGDRAGDRMRRGTILVEGTAGHFAGSRMIAGTLIVCRRTGRYPGYLMRRGTIVLGEAADALSPTFVDCGVSDLVASRLLAAFAASYSRPAARVFARPLRRLAGDMAVLGKGETFIAVAR